jgi:hypothetical protein
VFKIKIKKKSNIEGYNKKKLKEMIKNKINSNQKNKDQKLIKKKKQILKNKIEKQFN